MTTIENTKMSFDRKIDIKTTRLTGLDLYRIVSVLFIFLFHTKIHLGCDYGILNGFINMGAIFMTAFFMLSGYVLYYTYNKTELSKISNIKNFYCKRFLSIMPIYYVVALIFIIALGTESLFDNLLLAPIEILGMQSTFYSIFNVTHNGGTWFVSCLLICYLIYPYLQEIVKQLSAKIKIMLLLICTLLLLWSPFIVWRYSTVGTYSSPFYRLLEFLIGVILCSLKGEIEEGKSRYFLFSWIMITFEFLILVAGVSAGLYFGIGVGNYMLYSWIGLPMFALLLISLSGMGHVKVLESKHINYLCSISYAFFFAQFFTWKTTKYIISILHLNNNLVKIILSLIVCLFYSIVLHELVEKPIAKYLNRKILKI